MGQLTITYKCCEARYSMPTEILGASNTVPALDKLHAEQHPQCPPLDAPLPARPLLPPVPTVRAADGEPIPVPEMGVAYRDWPL